ncbi:hypothetical protein PJP10_26885 [Mycobacterium kansasii]
MTAKQPAPTLVAGRNRHWPARTHKQRRSRPSQVVRHLIFAGETMPQRWNPEWALVRVFRELPSTVGCRRASPPAAPSTYTGELACNSRVYRVRLAAGRRINLRRAHRRHPR